MHHKPTPPILPSLLNHLTNEVFFALSFLIHNHPSGDPSPSTADIKMTHDIIAIAKPLGIAIHDHLIIGRAGHSSLRSMKFI